MNEPVRAAHLAPVGDLTGVNLPDLLLRQCFHRILRIDKEHKGLLTDGLKHQFHALLRCIGLLLGRGFRAKHDIRRAIHHRLIRAHRVAILHRAARQIAVFIVRAGILRIHRMRHGGIHRQQRRRTVQHRQIVRHLQRRLVLHDTRLFIKRPVVLLIDGAQLRSRPKIVGAARCNQHIHRCIEAGKQRKHQHNRCHLPECFHALTTIPVR